MISVAITIGCKRYSCGTPPCSGIGMEWPEEDFAGVLDDIIRILVDDEGTSGIKLMPSDILDTGFKQDKLNQMFDPKRVTYGRIGEAIAESHLVHYRSCLFPWSTDRDKRNDNASLPGADLVGFATDATGDCLAFGEVKTSRQDRYPPAVMSGSKGMLQQLKRLRDCNETRDSLFRYLAHRAKNSTWRSRFKSAAKRYITNKPIVQIYRVLVRNVPPKEGDLRSAIPALSQDGPDGATIELLALYLPKNGMSKINKELAARRSGGIMP